MKYGWFDYHIKKLDFKERKMENSAYYKKGAR